MVAAWPDWDRLLLVSLQHVSPAMEHPGPPLAAWASETTAPSTPGRTTYQGEDVEVAVSGPATAANILHSHGFQDRRFPFPTAPYHLDADPLARQTHTRRAFWSDGRLFVP